MFVSALLPVKTFLTLKFLQKQNINIDKAEKKARRLKDNLSEYQGFNQPKFKYNQIRKQRLWRFLWNECSWKLGIIPTKACKGIQCFEKLYTAIMKPLPLKLIPSQVPHKNLQFQQQLYVLVHITFCWKSPTMIDCEKYLKMFKNTTEHLLLKPA